MYNRPDSNQKRPLAVPPVLAAKRLNLDTHQNGLQPHGPAIGPPIHPAPPIGSAAAAAVAAVVVGVVGVGVVVGVGRVVHRLYPQPPLSPLDRPVVTAGVLGPAVVLHVARPFQSLSRVERWRGTSGM